MLALKFSLSIAAFLLVIKVIRTESGTRREKFEYIIRAITGKSVWRMPTVRGVHDAYHSAHRTVYAISA